jgi:hypothetical protein
MEFSVSKINGVLNFSDFGGYETRNPSTFWCIQKADEKYKWADFNDVKIDTNDNYHGDGPSYIKNNFKHLVPDFVFHSWPQVGIDDYEAFVQKIVHAGLQPYEKNQVGWFGNSNTNHMRKTLLSIGNVRRYLFDIFDMHWIPSGNTLLGSNKYISTPDLVRTYSLLIDIEGAGPYSARLKTLLWSHRHVLLVDRPGNEFFFEFLKEWEHYIPVKRDLSDVIEKTTWCLENYENALIIAENAFQFSKMYLTRQACYDKWNDVICNLHS